MKPYPELIEGERHSEPVTERGPICGAPNRPSEQGVCSNGCQQEDAIIQVVNVGALKEEIEVGNSAGHYQEDQCSCRDERHNEAEQRSAGKSVGCRSMSWVFHAQRPSK